MTPAAESPPVHPADYDHLADRYAAAFPSARPWSSAEIETLATRSGGHLTVTPFGFAIGHVVLDEAELLTLLIDPPHQGHGHGSALLTQWEAQVALDGASRALLEVAATNDAAQALYASHGWQVTGRRPGYYATGVDALLMAKDLPR